MGDLLATPTAQLRRPASDPVEPPGVRRSPGRSGGGADMSVAEAAVDERAVRGTSGPILGMVLFVASEAMFFAAFFGAYFTIRAANHVWPPRGIPVPKLGLPAVATAMLVSSSFVLQAGVRAIRGGDAKALERWLGLTILLGVGFLA